MGKKRQRSVPDERGENRPNERRVRMLLRRPEGIVYRLPEISPGSTEVQWVTVGSAAHCDFVVEGIADVHCSLECTAHGVTVHPRAGVETMVNKAVVREGHTELFRGAVLTLGPARLVACKDISDREYYTVRGLNEMIHESMALHGDNNAQAARTIGASPRTFSNWYKSDKFRVAGALALLCTALGLGWNMSRDEERATRAAEQSITPHVPESVPPESTPDLPATSPIPAASNPAAATSAAIVATPARETVQRRRDADTRKRRPTSHTEAETRTEDKVADEREPASLDEERDVQPRFRGSAHDVGYEFRGGAFDVEPTGKETARGREGASQ